MNKDIVDRLYALGYTSSGFLGGLVCETIREICALRAIIEAKSQTISRLVDESCRLRADNVKLLEKVSTLRGLREEPLRVDKQDDSAYSVDAVTKAIFRRVAVQLDRRGLTTIASCIREALGE